MDDGGLEIIFGFIAVVLDGTKPIEEAYCDKLED